MPPDQDDTVRLSVPAAGPLVVGRGAAASPAERLFPTKVIAGLGLLGFTVILGAILLWRDQATTPPGTAFSPPANTETAVTVPMLTEAGILALTPASPAMVRLQENPRVFVLIFPDLSAQGAALNRVAALIEKASLPRDRVVTSAELAAAIEQSGGSAATWYLAHDYRGADLQRFFSLAARDGVTLEPEEQWVAARLAAARTALGEAGPFAVISVAVAGGASLPDAGFRTAILRHEVSHGHYFTLPDYAAHMGRVWREGFTEADRAALRRFLAREGYDSADEDLMINEAQAYLLFTPDSRLFSPAVAGLTEPQVERLRGLLRAGLPLPTDAVPPP